MNPYLLAAVCIATYMLLLYAVAVFNRDNTIADAGWGIGLILVTFATLWYSNTLFPKQKLVMFLTTIWGLRLSSYLLIRHWGQSEDFRYSSLRKIWGKQAPVKSGYYVFGLHGLLMFMVSLPMVVINSTPRTDFADSLYVIGAAVWLIGFIVESVADHELFFFKEDPHHKGKVMTHGLWKFSRHPNYFGEIMVWWGIYIISIPSGHWYVSIWSPLIVSYYLLRVTGIPLLEKKFRNNPAYEEYKKKTSIFFPWPPKR